MAGEEQKVTPHLSPFDTIRHIDEQFGEYWSARELYKILGYTEWRNFHNVVIKRALKACEENGRAISEHFVQSYKMSKTGQGGRRRTEDVLLSRYSAYLVVMNGDPKMLWHKNISPSRRVGRNSLSVKPMQLSCFQNSRNASIDALNFRSRISGWPLPLNNPA